MSPLPTPDDERLHWLAALYVAEEASPEEAAEFEALLSSDLAAQEALCNWIEITQAVRLVEGALPRALKELTPAQARSSRRRLRSWMAAGLGALAAAVLIALGQWMWMGGGQALAVRPAEDGTGSTLPAAGWPEGFTLTQVVSLSHVASHAEGDFGPLDAEATLTDADATTLDVPTWMLAAVKLPEPEATP